MVHTRIPGSIYRSIESSGEWSVIEFHPAGEDVIEGVVEFGRGLVVERVKLVNEIAICAAISVPASDFAIGEDEEPIVVFVTEPFFHAAAPIEGEFAVGLEAESLVEVDSGCVLEKVGVLIEGWVELRDLRTSGLSAAVPESEDAVAGDEVPLSI